MYIVVYFGYIIMLQSEVKYKTESNGSLITIRSIVKWYSREKNIPGIRLADLPARAVHRERNSRVFLLPEEAGRLSIHGNNPSLKVY